ncbi:MAG: D-2-hydroxyacid dehydrogenase [Bavariicoccus seileri]|uniref:D-2-hydroxyacid dehydrogenase n=1 Tax=Bavariicoccus seileri TaxID=549685 RepID=UPI003F986113
MYAIKMFNVRDEEKRVAEDWAKRHNVKLSMSSEGLTAETIYQLKDFDGVSLSQIGNLDATLYESLHKLGIKQIAQRSAGVDMYDLKLAKSNNILVSNVPSYSPESIAEFTVSSALQLVRKAKDISAHVDNHNFSWSPDIRGRVLGDMTIAVLGTGRIGQFVAKFFHGFGAKIVAYDVYRNDSLTSILEYKDSVVDAIKEADIISLHMPALADNYHLFNDELFRSLKPNAILLNMARGALVDTEALLRALDENRLAAAALDTYEFESPYVAHDYTNKSIKDELFVNILNHPKISYTPHIAFYTDEAVKNLVEGGLNATLEVIETGTTPLSVN